MASVKELNINSTTYDIKGKTVVDNNSGELSFWSGTKAQYDAIQNKNPKTLYSINDDTDVSLTILEALYPIGSVYITTADTCPLSTLISGSTWTQETCRQLVEKKEPTDNDPSWYNLYSDGWCEQGGDYTLSSNNSSISISFLKPFNSTNYSILVSKQVNNNFDQSVYAPKIRTRSTTGFIGACNTDVANSLFIWQACGYTSTTTSHKQFRRTA